jgi:hypothetical protein
MQLNRIKRTAQLKKYLSNTISFILCKSLSVSLEAGFHNVYFKSFFVTFFSGLWLQKFKVIQF